MAGIVDEVIKQFNDLNNNIGRAGAHQLFPNDFEYYLCALELVDINDEVIDMLIFPVMPDSISEDWINLENAKKSSSSVVSLFTPTFIPFDISLTGTFGRKFKVLFGGKEIFGFGSNLKSRFVQKEFNSGIKTGYGVTKILESICKRSISIDDNGFPYKLFFYNLAFNSNYLVEVRDLNFTQSLKGNFMWDYRLVMRALAPAFETRNNYNRSLIKLLSFDVLAKSANSINKAFLSEYEHRKSKRQNSNGSVRQTLSKLNKKWGMRKR